MANDERGLHLKLADHGYFKQPMQTTLLIVHGFAMSKLEPAAG